MLKRIGLALVVFGSAAMSGCLHQAIRSPEELTTNHDQVSTFVAQRPFDEVHDFVNKAATKCYSKGDFGWVAPAEKNIYVPAGGGVHREVDDKVIEPGKLAMISVVVRGGPPPLGPENYFLRADIKSLGPAETEITTYNAVAVKGQRAFHQQVHRWAVDEVEDCELNR